MSVLYYIAIKSYAFFILLASPFNKKAGLWVAGRRNLLQKIKEAGLANTSAIWMHVSSLGEFEQGRPLLEEIRKKYPKYKIILTFFSPSGYEIRKNYEGADYIFYLPNDGPLNARRFIDTIQPEIAIFVKYDFWYFYMRYLNMKRIPVFLISAVFRPGQLFFKWYGAWYRKLLTRFTHIFVQDKPSADLLKGIHYNSFDIAGDTRIDRVAGIALKSLPNSKVEAFKNEEPLIVVGSTWPQDEEILLHWYKGISARWKLIIAPHNVEEDNINRLCQNIGISYQLYSKFENKKTARSEARILIIDNIGLLSSLYRYADIAYIGGAFGKGLHNILEPATFGIPVIFGPKYHKFSEAVAMVQCKAAFSVKNGQELEHTLNELIHDEDKRKGAGIKASVYVKTNEGATQKVFQQIKKNL